LDAVAGDNWMTLYRNRLETVPGSSATSLRVWVLDELGMPIAFGATARLREIGGAPHTTQTRVVDGGSGYLTQNEYPLHFAGLGNGHYSLDGTYPGTRDTWARVNGAVQPILADFVLGALPSRSLRVFRDGRVLFGPPGTVAVP